MKEFGFFSKENNWSEIFQDMKKINYEILEKIYRENMTLLSRNMVYYTDGIELMSTANPSEDFLKSKMMGLVEHCKSNVEYGKNICKIFEEGLEHYQECITDNLFSETKSTPKMYKTKNYQEKRSEP